MLRYTSSLAKVARVTSCGGVEADAGMGPGPGAPLIEGTPVALRLRPGSSGSPLSLRPTPHLGQLVVSHGRGLGQVFAVDCLTPAASSKVSLAVLRAWFGLATALPVSTAGGLPACTATLAPGARSPQRGR